MLALLLVLACGDGADSSSSSDVRAAGERWQYLDLLTQGVFDAQLAQPPRQLSCHDETVYALSMDASSMDASSLEGDSLEAEIELGRMARLQLSGCIRNWHETPATSRLQVEIESAAGEVLTDEVELHGQPGWWRWTTDLHDFESGPARLRLHLDGRPGQQLHLKDIVLRQRVPAPPPLPATSTAEARQILLISVDTLRADSIGALGGWGRTPHLDEFVNDAQAWQPHYAASSWTQPSHATLFTGFDYDVHQVDDSPLPAGLPTLAERLRGAGLRTWGLVHDCVWLDPKFDFDRGFDSYRSVPWTLEPMNRELMNWLGAHRDQPFFAFFHTFEPHSDFHKLPYESPGTSAPEVRDLFQLSGSYPCGPAQPCASLRLKRIREQRIAPLPSEPRILHELYRRSVEHTDAQLGKLFQHLRDLGLYDRMLIVLTSDHGEMLLERGATLHGLPWQPVTRVPLLIKWPAGRFAGERQQVPSAAVDVVPTLLQAAGLRLNADLQGVPLLSRREDRPIFSAMKGYQVVWHGTHKGIFPRSPDVPAQLYNLRIDPDEAFDLSVERPDVAEQLRGILQARQAESKRLRAKLLRQTPAAGASDDVTLTDEERQRLESLGYGG